MDKVETDLFSFLKEETVEFLRRPGLSPAPPGGESYAALIEGMTAQGYVNPFHTTFGWIGRIQWREYQEAGKVSTRWRIT